jgi:CRISPR-associated protein Csh2
VNIFDDAIVKSIPLEATTRSKIGQRPLLYIRVEYNNAEYFLGDLRKYLKIVDEQNNEFSFDDTAKLRSPKDYKLDASELCAKLKGSDPMIQKIHYWKDTDFNLVGWEQTNDQKIKKL